MSKMINIYQRVNKKRRAAEMNISALTMFSEAWDYQQAKIDSVFNYIHESKGSDLSYEKIMELLK